MLLSLMSLEIGGRRERYVTLQLGNRHVHTVLHSHHGPQVPDALAGGTRVSTGQHHPRPIRGEARAVFTLLELSTAPPAASICFTVLCARPRRLEFPEGGLRSFNHLIPHTS